MKTKVLKTVLPVFTMLFAIGLAFATNSRVNQKGYYDDPAQPGIQEITTFCVIEGEENCMFDGFQVYANSGLSIPLYERD